MYSEISAASGTSSRSGLAEALNQIIQAILATESVGPLLEVACSILHQCTGCAFARAWTLNAQAQTLELTANAGFYTGINGPLKSIPLGKWLVGKVAAQRVSCYERGNLSADNHPQNSGDMLAEPKFACVPMVRGKQCLGVISLGDYCPDINEQPLLDRIAEMLALAIDRIEQSGKWHESNQQLQAVLKINEIGTWIWDCALGRLRCDNNACNLLGIQVRDPDWNTILKHIMSEDVALVQNTIRDAMESPRSFRIWFRSSNTIDHERWFELKGSSHFTSAGLLVALPCALIEITRSRQFEQQLKAARLQAEAANRSRGRFLAHVSHEILTPMTVIMGSVDILKQSNISEVDQIKLLDSIRSNGEFLLKIVEDILDLSTIDAGKLKLSIKPVDIRQLMTVVHELFHQRCSEKQLELNIVTDDCVPQLLMIDETRLRQVITNILGNSVKFTHRGGISVTSVYDKARSRLIIEVTDSGIGIPQEFLQYIFKPFERANSTQPNVSSGFGLGLAICRGIIDAMGGEIGIRSSEQQGSVFNISLPTQPAEATALEGGLQLSHTCKLDTAPKVNRQCGQYKILVVDDREEIRSIVRYFIQGNGGKVTSVASGQQAIERLSVLGEEICQAFDAILMDIQMPILNGRETAKKIRELGFQGSIIALTADSQALEGSADDRELFNGLITKPIQPAKLMTTLSDLLSRN